MKKKLIVLLGVFALVACSDETAHQTESDISSDGNSGVMQPYTVDPNLPYESPYDMSGFSSWGSPDYIFQNLTDLELVVSPYAGVAFYDGNNDGFHFSWGVPFNPLEYPNLFSAEYINFVRLVKMQIAPYSTLSSGNGPLLPLNNNNFFDIQPPTHDIERSLLHEYGKLYSFEYEIHDNGSLIETGELRFPFLPNGINDPNELSDQWKPLTSVGGYECNDLWYNVKTLEINVGNSDTQYCLLDPPINKMDSQKLITHPITGNKYILKAYMTTTEVIISFENY